MKAFFFYYRLVQVMFRYTRAPHRNTIRDLNFFLKLDFLIFELSEFFLNPGELSMVKTLALRKLTVILETPSDFGLLYG